MPTSTGTNYSTALVNAWREVTASLSAFLPNLIAAVAVFLIGWIVAGWIRSLTIRILETVMLSLLCAWAAFILLIGFVDE